MCPATQRNPPPVATTTSKPYAIFLTDRRRCGAPIRLVSKRGKKAAPPGDPPRFYATHFERHARRFESERDARSWWANLPDECRLKRLYRATIDTL